MNKIIGIGAVLALLAIFYFGHRATAPEPEQQAVPTVVTKPVPAPKAPKPKPGEKVVYHRVGPDGKQGPEIACTDVKSFAEGKSPAELAALAKQYGVSVADVQRWYVCVQ